jgi:hypothetical protein
MKLTLIFILSSILVTAQNILRDQDQKDWSPKEQEALAQITPPKFKFPFPDLETYKGIVSWQMLAQIKIGAFSYNSRAYAGDSSVICAYSIFGLSNMGEDISNEFRGNDSNVRATFHAIYQNKSLHSLLYNWLKSSLLKSWKNQPTEYKNTIKGLMNYVLGYLKTFDLKAETAYLENLKKNQSEYDFCSTDRFKKHSPFRKGAAWCYRRIAAGHMSAPYLIEWCIKIQNEILTQ